MHRGFTMLLAEDDPNDLALFRRALDESSRKTNLRIVLQHVHDGADAIAYLSGKPPFAERGRFPFPDLVVLDLKMPRLTGLDVLAWLDQHQEYRRIPKILFSGSSQDEDIDAAYRLGVTTYFQKPHNLNELRALIHHMVCYWAHTERPVIRHVVTTL